MLEGRNVSHRKGVNGGEEEQVAFVKMKYLSNIKSYGVEWHLVKLSLT